MTPTATPRPRAGRPPATSRAQVLDAARLVIERDGWERLTVRHLATVLGVGTATLYRHVRDREDLLVQLVDDQLATSAFPGPDDLPEAPRDRVLVAATALHDVLAGWPWAAEVLTSDGFVARVGDQALGIVETIVGGAVECGSTAEQAIALFRDVWYYTVGEILVRAHSGPGRGPAAFARPAAQPFRPDPSRFPHLADVADRWVEVAARDAYSRGLRALVDGHLGPDGADGA